jgi:Helix-turn-helix domain
MSKLAPIFTWRSAILHSELPSTTKLVALAISVYLNEMTHTAWPSNVTLARDTSLGLSTVRRCLGVLEEGGWLEREERRGKTSILHSRTPPALGGVSDRPLQERAGTPPAAGAELEKELVGVSSETPGEGDSTDRLIGRKGRRDLLWEVFDREVGLVTNDDERGRRNKALKSIRSSLSVFLHENAVVDAPTAAAGELTRRCRRFRDLYPSATLTETAISTNWRTLGPPGAGGLGADPFTCPDCNRKFNSTLELREHREADHEEAA